MHNKEEFRQRCSGAFLVKDWLLSAMFINAV